jgi:HSP20 family molecular chaperone IbpA
MHMANHMQTTSSDLRAREKQAVEGEVTRPGPVFRPDVDILERADAFVVVADLPGVDANSVDVKLEKGVLTLDAQITTRPESGWTPIHSEYRIGDYHREFRISEGIDASGVSASMKNGVLERHLPKSGQLKPRTISVRTG